MTMTLSIARSSPPLRPAIFPRRYGSALALLALLTLGLVQSGAAAGRAMAASPDVAVATPAVATPAVATPAVAAPAVAAPGGAAPGAAAPSADKKADGPVPPEDMEGLSFEGLSDEQKALVVSLLNEHGCDCGCGMKLAVCRRDDSKCQRSLGLGKDVIGLVKQGKGKAEIVKSVLVSPSKFVMFDLKAGDSPALGPADAKVTILHYTDYQ